MALPLLLFRYGARLYDWMTAHDDWRADCARLAALLPPREQARVVLDLGCGPGVSSLAIARALPCDRVVGVDLVEAMLRRAQRADADDRCAWVQGDAAALPFADGSVDAVTGHSFLYLLADREAALAEIRRVLRPGGSVLLVEPSRQPLGEAACSVASTLRRSGPRLAFTMACWRIAARASGAFGPGELAATLEAAGFEAAEQAPTLDGLAWIGRARTRARQRNRPQRGRERAPAPARRAGAR